MSAPIPLRRDFGASQLREFKGCDALLCSVARWLERRGGVFVLRELDSVRNLALEAIPASCLRGPFCISF